MVLLTYVVSPSIPQRSPDYPEHVDFMTADTDCYSTYDGADMHNYSTFLYTEHALDIIEQHPEEQPLFL